MCLYLVVHSSIQVVHVNAVSPSRCWYQLRGLKKGIQVIDKVRGYFGQDLAVLTIIINVKVTVSVCYLITAKLGE